MVKRRDGDSERLDRLGAALRANLRRRKAASGDEAETRGQREAGEEAQSRPISLRRWFRKSCAEIGASDRSPHSGTMTKSGRKCRKKGME